MTTVPSAVLHPTHAAFAGFRLIKRRWRSILVWAALRFVCNLAMALAIVLLARKDLDQLADMAQFDPNQPGAIMAYFSAVFHRLEPVAALTLPVGFVLQSVMLGAVYRAFLRPEQSRWAYLRLGREELVIAAVTVLWWVLYLVCLMVFTFGVVLMTSVAQAISPVLGALWAMAGVVAEVALLVWALVRSSLAWVDSFDRGSVSLFHSLKLTRGHVLRILGAYLLALAVMLVASVVALLAFIILASVAALASGQGLATVSAVFDPDRSSLGAYFSVAMVAWLMFNALTGAASYAALFGPSGEVYLAFKAQGEEDPDAHMHRGPWPHFGRR